MSRRPRPVEDRCRVSEDELAHDIAEMAKPLYTCTRCGTSETDDPVADNWLVCKEPKCEEALCEDCVCELSHNGEVRLGDTRYYGWEETHNAGYCSPACMARDLTEAKRKLALMRERLKTHCDNAQGSFDRAQKADEDGAPISAFVCSQTGLRFLNACVREVCK